MSKKNGNLGNLVPLSQAASFLGVSAETVRRWALSGKIKSLRPEGKEYFFEQTELDIFKKNKPLSISEAATRLGVSVSTLRRYEEQGLIKPLRNEVGDRQYTAEVIDEYLDTLQEKQNEAIQIQHLGNKARQIGIPSKLAHIPRMAPKRKDMWSIPTFALFIFAVLAIMGLFAGGMWKVLNTAKNPIALQIPPNLPLSREEKQHEQAASPLDKGGNGGIVFAASDSNTIAVADTREGKVLGVSTVTTPDFKTTVTLPSSFIVDLSTDNTYFRVKDHTHDVFRVDFDKNVSVMPGATLHLLGRLRDKTGSYGEEGEVLTSQGKSQAPVWKSQNELVAGDLSCDDCLTSRELGLLEDLAVSGTTTFNGVGYNWPNSDGSSGQVLGTDGVGSLAWTTISASTLNGFTISSPSAGQILIYDGVDSWDNKSVSGDATLASSGAFTLGTSGVTAASYGSASAIPVITVDAKGRITSATTAALSVAFTVAGTSGSNQTISNGDTLTIAAGTGITTTGSATDTLTVAATLGTSIAASEVDADSLDFSELQDTLDLDASTTINLGTSNLTINHSSSGDFIINNGGSVSHIFDDSGNVGLGTATANYKLTVQRSDGVTSGEHFIADFVRSGTTDAQLILGYRADGAAVTSTLIRSGNSLPLTLGTSSATTALTIINAGQVGISDTSPDASLEVVNDGSGDSFLVADSADGDTSPFVITSAGNVGIGTSSADVKLKVLSADNTQTTNIATFLAANSTQGIGIGYDEIRQMGSGGGHVLLQATTSGNVGIGAATPGLKLDVSGTGGVPASSGTTQTGVFRIRNSTVANVLDFGNYATSPYGSWIQSTDRTDLSQLYPIILQPNGGVVGIGGDTSPDASLEIINDGSGDSFLVADTNDGDASPFVITSAGNVGIGTAAPSVNGSGVFGTPSLEIDGTQPRLVIDGSSDAGIWFNDSGATSGQRTWITYVDGGTYFMRTASDAGGSLSTKFSISNDGATFTAASTTATLNFNLQNSSNIHGYVQYNSSTMSFFAGHSSSPQLSIEGPGSGIGEIGIGDTTPDASLEVVNDGSGDSFLVADTNDGDTTPFVIDSTGNVGIFTASPQGSLDISNGNYTGVGTPAVVIGADIGATSRTNNSRKAGGITHVHYTNSSNVPFSLIGGDSTATYNKVLIGGGLTYTGATDIAFYTAATTTSTAPTLRMLIDTNGLVGIGNVVSTSAMLHVQSNATTTRTMIVQAVSSQTANLQEWRNSVGTVLGAMSADGLLSVGLDATPDASLEVINDGSGDSFLVADSADEDTSPFVITSTGAVAIGTTSLTSKLNVVGSLVSAARTNNVTLQAYSPAYELIDKDGVMNWYFGINDNDSNALNIGTGYGSPQGITPALKIGTDNQFTLTTGGADGMYVYGSNKTVASNNAHILILSSDSYAIDKGGTIALGGSYTGTTPIQFGYVWGRKENSTDGNTAGYLAFGTRATNAAEWMRITSTGLVGIQDTSPDASLEVVNDGSGDSFLVADSADGDTTPFVITSAGDVGIGTSSPGRKLSISESTTWSGIQMINGGSGGRTYSFLVGNTAVGNAGVLSVFDDTASAHRLVLNSSGQFAVGASILWGAPLEVNATPSSTYGSINISASSAKTYLTFTESGVAHRGAVGFNSGDGTMYFYTNGVLDSGSPRLAIQSGGNVGIGDTSPSALLSVGSGDLFTVTSTGQAATTDGIVTEVVAGACDDSAFTTDTNGLICIDSTNGRIYYRYGGAWHYSAQTAGFQIPNLVTDGRNETEGLQVGDYVIGKLNQRLDDGALHGLYVKFDLATEIANVLANLDQSVTFLKDVKVAGVLTRNNEKVGKAIIPKGGTEVTVKYDQAFSEEPIVNATQWAEVPNQYSLVNGSKNGFTIRLLVPASEEVTFSWTALIAPNNTVSKGTVAAPQETTVVEEPEQPAEPTATPTPEVSATPEPTVEPTVLPMPEVPEV